MAVDPELQKQLARLVPILDLDYDLPNLRQEADTSDFDLTVSIGGTDPDTGEEVFEELLCTVLVDAHVEDFGIGGYEFWGAKGNDVQMGWEIDKLEFETPWPAALAGIAEKILSSAEDTIREMDTNSNDDFEPDFDDRDYDREDW